MSETDQQEQWMYTSEDYGEVLSALEQQAQSSAGMLLPPVQERRMFITAHALRVAAAVMKPGLIAEALANYHGASDVSDWNEEAAALRAALTKEQA